jgi:hypothetical protein
VEDLARKSLRGGILLSLDFLRDIVLSGDSVFVLPPEVARPFILLLNTDCPEVIGLVNHSATVLVMLKELILNYIITTGEAQW